MVRITCSEIMDPHTWLIEPHRTPAADDPQAPGSVRVAISPNRLASYCEAYSCEAYYTPAEARALGTALLGAADAADG
jgi:hypothetical protein